MNKQLMLEVQRLPKIELHVHLEGSIPPDLTLRIAKRNGVSLPYASVEQFLSLSRYSGFKGFSRLLLACISCIRKADDFFEIVMVMGRRLVAENVLYAEVSWTPQFYLYLPDSIDKIFEAMNRARIELRQTTGLELRWIIGLVRNRMEKAVEAYNWLISREFLDDGVVALGLGGPEPGFEANRFRPIFDRARSVGLESNPHAGETAGKESIWDAIHSLKPKRIGHGVRAIEDASLIDYIKEKNIMLEVCPTSNIKLSVYNNFEDHSIKSLIRSGCLVSINSDDPILFNTTLTHEYYKAVAYCGLTLDELKSTIDNALSCCHLKGREKESLIARTNKL